MPEPLEVRLGGKFTNQAWQVTFPGAPNWQYTLERTSNFREWEEVGRVSPVIAGPLMLSDTNVVSAQAFYRVRAERP